MRETFPSASVPALTNIGKAFLLGLFHGKQDFFCQSGVKKAGGDGQGVLSPKYCSIEMIQSVQSSPCAIAPQEQDVP